MNIMWVHVQIDDQHMSEVDASYCEIECLVSSHNRKLIWVGTDEVPDAVEAEDPAPAEVCPRILPLESYGLPIM